jgi:predicted transcriptional regulator
LLLCNRAQAEVPPTLKAGTFIAFAPSFQAKAILCNYPYIAPPRKLSETQRQDIVGKFLETIKSVKYIKKQLPPISVSTKDMHDERKKVDIDELELEFLITAGTGKFMTKTQIYEKLNLTRRKGREISEKLEKKGFIRTHNFGKVGIVEVLEPGRIEIAKKGLKNRIMQGGGFEHTVGVDYVSLSMQKQNFKIRTEVDIFGNRLDNEATEPKSGQKIFFNIGISDPDREAENILKILNLPAVQKNKFIFVARDAGFAAKVHQLLKHKGFNAADSTNFEIKKIEDYIK